MSVCEKCGLPNEHPELKYHEDFRCRELLRAELAAAQTRIEGLERTIKSFKAALRETVNELKAHPYNIGIVERAEATLQPEARRCRGSNFVHFLELLN